MTNDDQLCTFTNADNHLHKCRQKDISEIFGDHAMRRRTYWIIVSFWIIKEFQDYAIKKRKCLLITKIQAWPFSSAFWISPQKSIFEKPSSLVAVFFTKKVRKSNHLCTILGNSAKKTSRKYSAILRRRPENIHQCWITGTK